MAKSQRQCNCCSGYDIVWTQVSKRAKGNGCSCRRCTHARDILSTWGSSTKLFYREKRERECVCVCFKKIYANIYQHINIFSIYLYIVSTYTKRVLFRLTNKQEFTSQILCKYSTRTSHNRSLLATSLLQRKIADSRH